LTRDITEKGIDAVKFPDVGIFNTSMLENIVYRFILYLSETAPKRIAPCPLVKDWLNDYNISAYIKQDFERILPDGEYKYEHRFWNDRDENIFTKTVYERFKTMEDAFF
jgi:hypothetical protein